MAEVRAWLTSRWVLVVVAALVAAVAGATVRLATTPGGETAGVGLDPVPASIGFEVATDDLADLEAKADRSVLLVEPASGSGPQAGSTGATAGTTTTSTSDSAPTSADSATSTTSAGSGTSAPSNPSTTTAAITTTSRPPTGKGGYFATLPPGAALPSGAECATRVRPTAENVPENEPYNRTRGHRVTGTYLSINAGIAANDYEARLDGNFVGTTDEIIQWAACKWGFDEDLVRAQVYTESSWYAGKLGDCGENTDPRTGGAGGCSSVGLIQVRSAEAGSTHHPAVFPIAWKSSAMNLDYALAVKRLCYEGLESWLSTASHVPGGYQAGDEWNCMGRWFSGSFGDGGAKSYLADLRRNLDERRWEGPYVGCPGWRESFHCSGIDRPVE